MYSICKAVSVSYEIYKDHKDSGLPHLTALEDDHKAWSKISQGRHTIDTKAIAIQTCVKVVYAHFCPSPVK